MEINENKQEIIKRLDDPRFEKAWEYLSTKHGITKESLSDEQKYYLAIGASTTPIPSTVKTQGKEARVSLRIGKDDKILATAPLKTLDLTKVYTTEGIIKLTSERVKNDLSACSFISKDGKREREYHFVSSRYPVKNENDKEFVVSRDKMTNRLVGQPCALIYSQIRDWEHLYGAKITDESKKHLARGHVVVLDMPDKQGNTREVAFQYSAAVQAPVQIPIELLKKIEIDTYRQKPEQAVEQKEGKEQKETKTKGQKAEAPQAEVKEQKASKGKKAVKPVEEPKEKETKGKKMKV